ncbi:MAG: UDP-N-acetylglucosamine 2-epimerase (non-hydrolyzing) [Bacteroidales bacterium]|jgi:UDP-N-acetylglucosamine 2-epimerase (non-hydrolysing)
MPDIRVKRILLIFGTRPEAIKMAPLVMEFARHKDLFETRVCVTAQHRQMLDQVLDFFQINPDYDLNIMKTDQEPADVAASVLTALRPVFNDFKPDYVMVQGDTTSAVAAALAAFYEGIPVCHVEAGLRTHTNKLPFPEEMNRQLISRMADWNFAPTDTSKENLTRENIPETTILVSGNTVVDALLWTLKRAESEAGEEVSGIRYQVSGKPFILVTGHRRENLGEGIDHICEVLAELARTSEYDIVYPVHLNPKVHDPVYARLQGIDGIHLIPPVSYPAFVWLMKECLFILTDSGGIQEEAPALGKQVLVMREATERPEALESGMVKLIGTDPRRIISECRSLIGEPDTTFAQSAGSNPFGNGDAARRIVNFMMEL